MTIDKELQTLVNDAKILAIAQKSIKSWMAEEENEKISKSAMLKFINHKLCFKSSLVDYPYIETTFQIIVNAKNIGSYRLITLLDGRVDNDYYEIY